MEYGYWVDEVRGFLGRFRGGAAQSDAIRAALHGIQELTHLTSRMLLVCP